MQRRRGYRRVRAVTIGIVAAVLATIAGVTVLDGAERDLIDARFRVLPPERSSADVLVVAIDEDVIEQLGFPFDRRHHAAAIDALLAAGARRVVYDVQFSEPSDDPRADRALLRAAADPRVVLGTSETFADGEPDVVGGANALRRTGGRVGQVLYPLDDDGVWRRFDGQIHGVPHVAVLAADGPADAHGRWIAYAGPPGTVRELVFTDVLEGRLDPGTVRGRIAVVGVTAPVAQDRHPTSVGGGQMAGPEIIANTIQTVRDGFPLRDLAVGARWLLVLVAGMIAPLAAVVVRPSRAVAASTGAGTVAVGVVLVGGWIAFRGGVVVPLAAPLAAIVLGTVGTVAVHYRQEIRDRRRLRRNFERFVAPDIAAQIMSDHGDGNLPSRTQPATIVFCDLRGFTGLTDALPPERVVVLLNRYLAMVSDAIFYHGGTVVSFQGDGVLAAFGVPVPRDDHATCAWRASRLIVDEGLPTLDHWAHQQGFLRSGEDLRVGIGIHSGPVVSGLVGSERRVEYAAVGATTNAAARLQSLGRDHSGVIFLSAETATAIDDPLPPLHELGPVTLRGRAVPIEVLVLVEDETPPVLGEDAKPVDDADQDFGVQTT